MRLSKLYVPTLREDPADAEIASHRLLLRAGLVRQVMSGVYVTLPLGLRVMRTIEAIIRDEMDATGANEIRMPITLPAEPWRATGRSCAPVVHATKSRTSAHEEFNEAP